MNKELTESEKGRIQILKELDNELHNLCIRQSKFLDDLPKIYNEEYELGKLYAYQWMKQVVLGKIRMEEVK